MFRKKINKFQDLQIQGADYQEKKFRGNSPNLDNFRGHLYKLLYLSFGIFFFFRIEFIHDEIVNDGTKIE